MKIGIDARILKRGITGTGRYLMNLLYEIPNYDKQNEYYLFVEGEQSILENYYKNIKVKNKFIPQKMFSFFWLNLILPRILKKEGIEIFYTPNIMLPLVKRSKVRYMTVIHDIIPLIKKEYYPFLYRNYLKLLLPLSIKTADTVFTVSVNSKNDIIDYFKTDEKKIVIVHANALDNFRKMELTQKQIEEISVKYGLDKDYILYVGGIDYRKNIPCLLKTIDALRQKGIKKQLIIVGKRYFCDDLLFDEIEKRKGYVKYFSYIEDEILPLMYNMAFCFVFPTYYEGFGIPPLEAMQSGIPVIASNNSSLPEVVGDGGILVDADDYMTIANEIERLVNDREYYEFYKSKGIMEAKRFSAAGSAKKLISIFNGAKNE